MSSLIRIFLGICLVLFFVIPRSYFEFKLIPISITITLILLRINTFKISKEVAIFTLAIVLVGFYGCILGIFYNNNDIAIIESFRLFVIYPICYMIISSIILLYYKPMHLDLVFKISLILICLINAIGLLKFSNIFSENFILQTDLKIGFHDGYTRIMTQNIGSLIFLAPYFITKYFEKKNKYDFIFMILSLAIVILSGRRALWGITLFNIIFLLIYKNKFFGILLTLLVTTTLFIFINFDSKIIDFLTESVSKTDERYIQARYLINAIKENPILGYGFGNQIEYVRNFERPWIFEISFLQFFMNIGIASLFLLLLYFIYIVKILQYDSDHYLNSIIFGVILFGLSSFTNPYIGSWDFIFILYLIPISLKFKKIYK